MPHRRDAGDDPAEAELCHPPEGPELAQFQRQAGGPLVEGPGKLIISEGQAPHWDSPEYAARIEAAREDLGKCESIHFLLRREAKRGDVDAAWMLISMLADELETESTSRALRPAAAFFAEFDRIRGAELSKVQKRRTRDALLPALAALGVVRRRGRPAKSGSRAQDIGESWTRIRQLEAHFRGEGPLLRWAAGFFRHLLKIRERDAGAPSARQLGEAFSRLHLVPPAGNQQRLDHRRVASILAAEELERTRIRAAGAGARSNASELARGKLAGLGVGGLYARDLRSEQRDLVRIISPNLPKVGRRTTQGLLTENELEALADDLNEEIKRG